MSKMFDNETPNKACSRPHYRSDFPSQYNANGVSVYGVALGGRLTQTIGPPSPAYKGVE